MILFDLCIVIERLRKGYHSPGQGEGKQKCTQVYQVGARPAIVEMSIFCKMERKLPTESLDKLFDGILSSSEWGKAQADFSQSDFVYIIGNGGNLAVADHGAVDITRLSKKLAIAPGSGILATSIIGDNSIDTWFTNWLEAHISQQSLEQKSRSMLIGVSSSGTAGNILTCLDFARDSGLKTLMLSGRYQPGKEINTVSICTDYYHTGEVISLLLFYQLIHGSGGECPSISQKVGQKSFDRLINP